MLKPTDVLPARWAVTAGEGTVLCPPCLGCPGALRAETEAGKHRFPSGFQDTTSRGEGLAVSGGSSGSGWDERSRVRSCISSPHLLPPFPGWQREGEKVNNAQTPRGPAVAAAPDISPTCLPRQTFCRDPRAALLSSISCSLTTARNWQQPL